MYRRDFLRNAGLLGAAVVAPPVLVEAAQIPDQQYVSEVILTGKVRSNSVGIAGVSVTDGVNVVSTNSNGEYKLISSGISQFVYISLPSGYEFPHEESLVRYYKKIDHSSNSFNADFELKKLSTDDNNHVFILWSDTQIQNKRDAELLLKYSSPDLKALVDTYQGLPVHGIGCGDLVWDNFSLFPDYQRAIAHSGIPFFNVIGNHDMDLTARTDEGSSVTFRDHFGPTYYSYNRGKIHYVVLDDVFFVGVDKKYIGYLTENQLSWLEQDVKSVKPGSTVVVSLHIPTKTGQPNRNKRPEEMGGSVTNRKRLYDILKNFNVHIMSGHTHFNEVWTEGNITEHVHGTVCGAWWTGDICGDGTPNGYGVYEVKGDELSWYYKSTGKPKSHQIRIYPPGRHKEYLTEVCINIWNYDPKWKVECFADGRAIGKPEQRTAFDPWAFETMEGLAKPNPRGFVEPNLSDHIFFIKVPEGTKSIRVQASDPFGNVYQEALALS